MVARQIHRNSSRAKKPFVVVTGALLDPQHYELELFGSENKNETTNSLKLKILKQEHSAYPKSIISIFR